MKVDKTKGGLLIVPETGIEEQLLCEMYPHGETHKAFLKCGMTASEIRGVKVIDATNTELPKKDSKFAKEDNIYDVVACLVELCESNKKCITGESEGDPNYWGSFEYWIECAKKLMLDKAVADL